MTAETTRQFHIHRVNERKFEFPWAVTTTEDAPAHFNDTTLLAVFSHKASARKLIQTLTEQPGEHPIDPINWSCDGHDNTLHGCYNGGRFRDGCTRY